MTQSFASTASEFPQFGFAGTGNEPSLAELSGLAADILTKKFAELIAVLPSEKQEWATRLFSWLRVNGPRGDQIVTDIIPMYNWMATGLLELIDRGTLVPVLMTPESTEALNRLRAVVLKANLRPQAAPAAVPVASGPTQAELEAQADAEIVLDWSRLSTSDIRSRCRNEAYKTRFDRLMSAGRLGR